jgi:3-oxoacyl-[acyl-carrier protein] reductase
LKVLSREVAKDGVTVNSLQPGAHDTDRLRDLQVDTVTMARSIPARTLGSPQRFGDILAFLCSEQASFITGTSLLVDGGASAGLI